MLHVPTAKTPKVSDVICQNVLHQRQQLLWMFEKLLSKWNGTYAG